MLAPVCRSLYFNSNFSLLCKNYLCFKNQYQEPWTPRQDRLRGGGEIPPFGASSNLGGQPSRTPGIHQLAVKCESAPAALPILHERPANGQIHQAVRYSRRSDPTGGQILQAVNQPLLRGQPDIKA